MKRIEFQYKGQMVNYYNKVIANPNTKYATCYFDGHWVVEYLLK